MPFMQRKMALLELSNEADFFGFVTKNYIIPGIRTGEHSITFPIDRAYFQIYTLKIDSPGTGIISPCSSAPGESIFKV